MISPFILQSTNAMKRQFK